MDDVPKIPEQGPPQPLPQQPPQQAPQQTPMMASSEKPANLSSVVTEVPKPDTVISYTKKRSIIDYFIVIVSVVAFLIWIAVGALYLRNRQEKTPVKPETSQENLSPTSSPIPEKKYKISTSNGNVININEEGKEEILVNKEDHKMTGISGFIKVSVSPDQKRLCMESWPPSPEPSLFISDIDGQNVLKVNPNRKSCIWSRDSRLIAYNDLKAQNLGTDLYIFDPETSAETLLTVHTATESTNLKLHTATGWSPDNKKLLCEYSLVKSPKVISECEVDLDTKFVNYK